MYGVCLDDGGIYKKSAGHWVAVTMKTLRVIATAYDLGSWALPLLWVPVRRTYSLLGNIRMIGDEARVALFIKAVLTRFPGSVDMADNARRLVTLGGRPAGETAMGENWLETHIDEDVPEVGNVQGPWTTWHNCLE